MAVRLDWKGDELLSRVRTAEPRAIERTVEDTAAAARSDHPGWRSRTGDAEASITAQPARRSGTRVLGAIAFAIRPLWFLERGWIHHPSGDLTIERAANREFRDLGYRLRDAVKGR